MENDNIYALRAHDFVIGGTYNVEVSDIENDGVKVIAGECDGFISRNDLYWNNLDDPGDVVFIGEPLMAKYLGSEEGILRFSRKDLVEKPYRDEQYEMSVDELLKSIGHEENRFFGELRSYGKFAFVENLRTSSGTLLTDPTSARNLKAVVFHPEEILKEGYYEVSLGLIDFKKRIERNQLFQFYTKSILPLKENPYQKDVEDAFKRHTTDPSGNISLVSMLDEVGRSGYSSNDRVFYELLQNADDAAPQKGVSVNFNTSGNYLIMSHDGFSFNKNDFEAITSAANGTKKSEANTTGYKGIGFKSVFLDSQKVYISSSGYSFKFDKFDVRFGNFEDFYVNNNPLINKDGQIDDDARQRFLSLYSSARNQFVSQESIPWQLEPIWVDSMPIDTLPKNVTIFLEIGESNVKVYDDVITTIFRDPEFMLFLRSTNRIDFNKETISRSIKIINNAPPLLSEITIKNSYTDGGRVRTYKKFDFSIPVNDDAFEEFNIDLRIKSKNIDGKEQRVFVRKDGTEINARIIPPKIAINSETTISFAIPCSKSGGIIPLTKKVVSLYAFLPTSDAEYWTFPFFLNANFILMSNRESIQGDNIWNDYLLQKIAILTIELCKQLSLNGDSNALKILISNYFSEESPRYGRISRLFNTAYKSALESEAFILNHKGELAKQDEIIIDKTSLSEIVGAELFCKLLQTEKCLPSEKIDSKILEEDIFEEIELIKFDDIIDAITNNEDFNEWFISATDEQKKALYKWIDDNDITSHKDDLHSFVSNLPFFKFGEDYKSCEEIGISNYIVTTEHIITIKEMLSKLGFICSDNVFDESHPLYKHLKLQDEKELFDEITLSLLEQDGAGLSSKQKLDLFMALGGFSNVGPKHLSEIRFFNNSENQMCSLCEMFPYNENAPGWANAYMISKEENFLEIQKYLQDEFDTVWRNIGVITSEQEIPIACVYEKYKWTDEKNTKELIDTYKKSNNLEDLLSIVEDSRSETQRYFLDNIKQLNLYSDCTYKKDSYEYRVLQLALSVFDEPSNFSSKIFFDGQCIKDFSVSDDVVCEYTQNGETKKVKMSLAKILPQYQNRSNSIDKDKIKNLFETHKGLDKFFVAKSKTLFDVYNELNSNLGIVDQKRTPWKPNSSNAYQYLFSVYFRKRKWVNLYGLQIDLTREDNIFVFELMNWLFKNEIIIKTSPFTYHLKKYFDDKYFDSDYIFENEQLLSIIEQWADDDKKKQYLIENGVRKPSCFAIQFRKLFLENKPIDFIDKLSEEDLISGIGFIAMASGYERPFVGENQKHILLSIKEKCKNLSDDLNTNKIKNEAEEWNTPEYSEWIEEHIPSIFIYSGLFPKQIFYNDDVIINYEDADNDCYYDKEEQKLFISNTRKVEDILFEVAKEKKAETDFDFDDYKFLCWGDDKISVSREDVEEKEKTIESLAESNRKKDEIIELYRSKYGDIDFVGIETITLGVEKPQETSQPEASIGGRVGGDIPIIQQTVENKEAKQIVIEKLREQGFSIPDNNGDYSIIRGVEKDGLSYPVVVISCKNKDMRININPIEWEELLKPNSMLWIHWNGNTAPIKFYDLLSFQDKLEITIDTINIKDKEKIGEIMTLIRKLKGTHLEATLQKSLQERGDSSDYSFFGNNAANNGLESGNID